MVMVMATFLETVQNQSAISTEQLACLQHLQHLCPHLTQVSVCPVGGGENSPKNAYLNGGFNSLKAGKPKLGAGAPAFPVAGQRKLDYYL